MAALNVNVGILGHVDSGKTSLAKALSTLASTAAFDKNPQSKARGITLDLGFSAFEMDMPEHMRELPYERLQITLVDCPGHASLIRTIMGGAQIIDLMMLVVDATKGIQTQTAECLVIGEITTDKMVVVINKVDMYPEDTRDAKIQKMTSGLRKTLANTRFKDAPIIPVAANVGSRDDGTQRESIGLTELMNAIKTALRIPRRRPDGEFIFAVDHCFAIKGQGTVMTGTVLSGSVSVGETIELPASKLQRKIKSMQMFHKPVDKTMQGDRVGICVTQMDAKTLERGIVARPGTVPLIHGGIVRVTKIRFFKGQCLSKTKFHVTIGHETVMGTVMFFDTPSTSVDVTTATAALPAASSADGSVPAAQPMNIDLAKDYPYQTELTAEAVPGGSVATQWALLELDSAVPCPPGTAVIASRLDTDLHVNTCRLAFYGFMSDVVFADETYKETILPKLRVFKIKEKVGVVDRVMDDSTLLGRGMFKKETNIELFTGLKVQLTTGEIGVIESSFGQSGKFKVHFRSGLPEALQKLAKKKKDKQPAAAENDDDGSSSSSTGSSLPRIVLRFNRYVFDKDKRIVQSAACYDIIKPPTM